MPRITNLGYFTKGRKTAELRAGTDVCDVGIRGAAAHAALMARPHTSKPFPKETRPGGTAARSGRRAKERATAPPRTLVLAPPAASRSTA